MFKTLKTWVNYKQPQIIRLKKVSLHGMFIFKNMIACQRRSNALGYVNDL